MKVFSTIVLCTVCLFGVVGCGKTFTELRADKDAMVDSGGSFIKKLIDGAFAIYDVGKKVVEDTKDNFVTVKDSVTPGK